MGARSIAPLIRSALTVNSFAAVPTDLDVEGSSARNGGRHACFIDRFEKPAEGRLSRYVFLKCPPAVDTRAMTINTIHIAKTPANGMAKPN